MYAVDFEYDGYHLSDFGFTICNFGKQPDTDTVSAGSKITFNKVKRHRGKIHSLVGTEYDECIESTFQICKCPTGNDGAQIITSDEFKDLMRWLNRNEYLKFQMIDEDEYREDPCYYYASFNVEKILINRVLYGLELTMETNSPFGFGQEYVDKWTVVDTSKAHNLIDLSDEIGIIYPSMKITVNEGGTLNIRNLDRDCLMTIKNCVAGETIEVDGSTHIITSSNEAHRLYNDFNFSFFKVGNTFQNRFNRITVSLPATIEIRYSPIIKDSPE